MAQKSVELQLGDLEGIGPATVSKLKEVGIESVLQLAVAMSDEIMNEVGSREKAYELISKARKTLQENDIIEREFVRAEEALEWRKSVLRCTTGSEALDALFAGGIETQAITELYGEFGSGKTQIAHTLCAICHLPPEEGGLGGGAIYLDTEGTFRPERLQQIADARGYDKKQVLQNTMVSKVYNSSHLELIIQSLGKYIEQNNIKLIVVDSIMSLHRAEFTGRGTLAERQQRLNSLLHRLIRTADIYNVAIIATNQVMSQPDTFFGDPTKPVGGNIVGHACTYRVYLRKSGSNRKAIMVDSPYHPYSEAIFTVSEKGVVDAEEKEKKSKAP
ncbi:MAG: DNA repair and recombination protein RadA [Thaumarchaeota archaeon]|nr:DNA repair and recombination protein RadA [Nitrososphaerota archaeon]